MQLAELTPFWKRPAAQPAHAVAPSPENWPAAQLAQLSASKAPVVPTKVPAAQLVQLAAPRISVYWPALHGAQTTLPVALANWPTAQLSQLGAPVAA